MSRVTRPGLLDKIKYPTTDGKPMAETDVHRRLMNALIETLATYYESSPRVYVSGNLLLFYERGNRRRHVSPDVFVVKGVPKHDRLHYLLWEERKGPDFVIELTSSSARREDQETKFALYRDVLKVREYFLFDPLADYLDPPFQAFRLRAGQYVPIKAISGRFPSRLLGLHLERDGQELRLWSPATGRRLLTPDEARQRAEAEAERATAGRRQAEAEVERLRRELEELRRRPT